MIYRYKYDSPVGKLNIASDDEGLLELSFEEREEPRVYEDNEEKVLSVDEITDSESEEQSLKYLRSAKNWLDIYFSGKKPDIKIPYHFIGTDFQKEVWGVLSTVPYGQTMTYGDIANMIAMLHGRENMSAQAIGQAVGKNPISIIVPCHRVIGANGKLTGYAAGLDIKAKLLEIEGISI